MLRTILIADDEPKIVELAANYLKADGFSTLHAANGREALELFRSNGADCLLLDINMPGLDGLSVAREIRKASDVPIVFLTARSEEIDRIVGFEVGADDYIVKPFSPREMVARVKAILRRRAEPSAEKTAEIPGEMTCGEVTVNTVKRECSVDGRAIELTAAQFDILAFMMRSPGRVWTRLELLRASSGTAFEGYERTIDAQIKNIRKALGDDSESPRYVETVRGVGYRFMERRP